MTAVALNYAAATSASIASEPPTIIPSPYATQTPLSTPLATLIPVATPAIPRSEPQIADTLPLDQPWVIGPGGLLAVDQQGHMTRLRSSFDIWADRPGKPPLLITNPDSGSFAVLDPWDWSRTTIKFDIGEQPYNFFASPDGTEILFKTSADSEKSHEERLYIANLQTGTARLAYVHRINTGESSDKDPYDGWYDPTPIAWNNDVLYLSCQLSASLYFWKLDLNRPQPTPEFVYSIGEGGGVSQPNGTLLIVPGTAAQLVDLADPSPGTIKQLGQMGSPSFAPDGKTVAYATYPDGSDKAQLHTYDVASGATTMLGVLDNVNGGISWSDDGQRILVQSYDYISDQHGGSTRSARRIRLFTRDGTLLGEVQLPEDQITMHQLVDSLHLIGDDQVLFPVREGGRVSLHSVPFRAGDTPRYPAVWLPGGDDAIYDIIYIPAT